MSMGAMVSVSVVLMEVVASTDVHDHESSQANAKVVPSVYVPYKVRESCLPG